MKTVCNSGIRVPVSSLSSQGKQRLIRYLMLTVFMLLYMIHMPDLTSATKNSGSFYEGRSLADLQNGGLRALVFGAEADVSRVIYDCATVLFGDEP